MGSNGPVAFVGSFVAFSASNDSGSNGPHHSTLHRSATSLQIRRFSFDAVGTPDHHNSRTDDLPFVFREQFQLPLHQRLHDLADVGKIAWGGSWIVLLVSFDVLFKLLPSHFRRTAGHIPGTTSGGKAVMLLFGRLAAANEARRHFRDHLGHFALG